jgi:hypothetical protein
MLNTQFLWWEELVSEQAVSDIGDSNKTGIKDN